MRRLHSPRRTIRPTLEQLEERLTPAAGDLDLNFAAGEARFLFDFDHVNLATDLAVDAANRLVVSGRDLFLSALPQQFRLARSLPDGAADPAFGPNGDGTVSTGGFATRADFEEGAISQAVAVAAGKIVVAGIANENEDVAIALYTDTGTLIDQFTLDISADTFGYVVTDVAFDSAGRIVVLGTTLDVSGSDPVERPFVLRLHDDLTRDDQFGVQGVFLANVQVGQPSDFSKLSMAVLANDSIVVAVTTPDPNTSNDVVTVLRLDSTGVVDTTFGTNGLVSDNLGLADSSARVAGVVIQDTGAIVVAASLRDETTNATSFGLVRFTAGGALDTTFGTVGRTITSFGDTLAVARSVTLTPNGQIVVAGLARESAALARYSANGQLDIAFGDAGLVARGAGQFPDGAAAVAFQPNKGLVVAGGARDDAFNLDVALMRFRDESEARVGSGNLTAKVVLGELVIKGDSADTCFSLEPGNAGAGSYRVVGRGTTVNGQAVAVQFANVKSIKIKSGDGNDEIILDGTATNLVFAKTVLVDAGTGDDVIRAVGVTAMKSFTIKGGTGDDSVELTDAVFSREVIFTTSAGDDTLALQRVALALSLALDTGDDDDLVTLREVTLGTVPVPGRFKINGNLGNDNLDAGLMATPNANGNQHPERLKVVQVEQNLS